MAIVEAASYDQSRREFLGIDYLFSRDRSRGRQPPRRPTTRPQSPQPEPPHWGGLKVTRREALVVSSFIGGSIITAIILKPWTWLTPPDEQPKSQELGKLRLLQEIDNLPQSAIKTLLTGRVKPVYQPNPPQTLDFDGEQVKIIDPIVRIETQQIPQVRGSFNFRGKSFVEYKPKEPLVPLVPTTISFPYTGFVLASEARSLGAKIDSDDVIFQIPIEFSPNNPLYEGFYPMITVTSADPATIKPEFLKLFQAYRSFVYIKEACSQLLEDLWLTDATRKLHQKGIRTKIEVQRPNGEITDAEIISTLLISLIGLGGRTTAMFDIAGHIIALKAVEGTEIASSSSLEPRIGQLAKTVKDIDLGQTPTEIVYNSLKLALTLPEARAIHYVGDLNKIP